MAYELNDKDKLILKLIYTGHNTLCNLADYLGENAPSVMETIVKLDALGFLSKIGEKGNDTLAYKLSFAGENSVTLSEREKKLFSEYHISEEDVAVLRMIGQLGNANPVHVAEALGSGKTPMQVICSAENLENNGYIKMPGIIRCKLVLTPAGADLLKKVDAIA